MFPLPPTAGWCGIRCGCGSERTVWNALRYRVAAPSIRIVPWVARASCWPLPQQLLPVSATGGGRRRCTLRINSGIRFFIRDSEKPAGFSESPFHGRGRQMQRCELNSLSQSLMALPAPSGREPLAKPETLPLCQRPHPRGGCRRRRLGEFASGLPLPSKPAALPPSPRGRLQWWRQSFRYSSKASPWESCHRR